MKGDKVMNIHTSEMEKKYNDICGKAFVNIFSLSKETECILFNGLDLKNKEHLFLLHVALGVGSIVEKQVCLDKSRFTVKRLNRRLHIKDKGFKIISFKDTMENRGINPNEMLEFMRGHACHICGDDFTFGDIYKEYYSGKE
jgi:hypothetical protein